jgi:hypothetical protein
MPAGILNRPCLKSGARLTHCNIAIHLILIDKHVVGRLPAFLENALITEETD